MAIYIAQDGFALHVPAREPRDPRCTYCGFEITPRNDYRTVVEAGRTGYAHRYCGSVGEAPRG
jgi:hypothetical protein